MGFFFLKTRGTCFPFHFYHHHYYYYYRAARDFFYYAVLVSFFSSVAKRRFLTTALIFRARGRDTARSAGLPAKR